MLPTHESQPAEDALDATVTTQVQAARDGAAALVLPSAPVIAVQAEDLHRWLNGMFTNKYTDLPVGEGRRSVIVDDRGRVQGLVDWYCTAEDRFVGVLEGVDHDWFAERFKMFLLLDDIELDDLDDHAVLHLAGPGAADVLAAVGLPAPGADHAHLAAEHDGAAVRVARRDRSGLGGFDLLVAADHADALLAALADAGAADLSPAALDALRIVAGQASWPRDGTEKSMVHELGYNTDCVSFDKGCYLGQEVINRIERRGGVRKKLTRLQVDGPAPLAGAEVHQDGKAIGTVSSVARLDGDVWALGVLRESAWEAGTVVTIGEDAVPARVSPVG